MIETPWFMLSPSPVSLIQYAALSWILWGYFLRAAKYEKHARILSLLDAFFTVALFVCLTDAIWVALTMKFWLPLHPGDLWLLIQSLIRDFCGAGLFGLLVFDHFRSGVLELSKSAVFWLLVCALSQAAWFALAPSPVFTDYVYAWRHGSELWIVVFSWILSHWIMRIPLWLAIINVRGRQLHC